MPTANATTAAASTRRRRRGHFIQNQNSRHNRTALHGAPSHLSEAHVYKCVFVNEIHSAGQSEFVYNGLDKRLHNDSHAFKMLWGSTKRSHLTKDNIAFVCIYVWLCSVVCLVTHPWQTIFHVTFMSIFLRFFSVLKTETKIHCSTFVWFIHHM